MFSKKLLMSAALIVVLCTLALTFWPHGALANDDDGDGRYQTASWITGDSDPQFHLTPDHLHAVGGTQRAEDYSIEFQLKDSAGVELTATWISGPNGAAGGTVWIDNGLAGYGSGASFTLVALYKDANGSLNDTESISFTKP